MSGGKEQSSGSECCLTAVGEGGRHDTYSQDRRAGALGCHNKGQKLGSE